MNVKYDDILFFMSAGASKPFGIPTMQELTDEVENCLANNELDLYKKIKNDLQKKNSTIDIEHILSSIDDRIEGNTQTNNSDDLNSNIIAIKNSYSNRVEILKSRSKKLIDFIRDKCRYSNDEDHMTNVYQDFLIK
jgi:hypothetical protein